MYGIHMFNGHMSRRKTKQVTSEIMSMIMTKKSFFFDFGQLTLINMTAAD